MPYPTISPQKRSFILNKNWLETLKKITMDTLNGVSIGVIVALVPGALLNNIMKTLLPHFEFAQTLLNFTAISAVLLPVVSALCVGLIGKLAPIQSASMVLATAISAGNIKMTPNGLIIAGSGDVINVGLTILISYILILILGNHLKSYTILLLPSIILLIGGGIGQLTLKPVGQITRLIGDFITQVTHLQPLLMGVLLGISFALIIISPVSSVGIASAVGLQGIASGSANLGIVAASYALAVYGFKVNSLGASLAHIIGSPKIQMANILKKPKVMLPIAINSGVLGGLGALLNINGTPMSAGFGLSGLIGPIAALEKGSPIIILIVIFIIIPFVMALISHYVFILKWHFMDIQDFTLNYD
ncbi:membrane protein, putative toxin regulator [Holzapfeliella floricola DSM 23037 = JCM 16512]|uniref:Membrane protein, putative toxin regulator n=2 Tax=Holzapfeliella TaxID=2767883 RepID=A0A0R2DLN5_9LACO|nr:membrane protein, putative toxin regulator [Holzapfeliella floricola DSM 23037 = JCM 16512]